MRHLRRIVLAAVAVTLCIAPVRALTIADGGGAVVAPAKDKWLAEVWAQLYSLPVSENPFEGNGNPCLTLANKVIQEIGGHCTIEQGTALTLGFGNAWSNVEDPFPETREEQLAVATAVDYEFVAGMTVTVDGGDPVDIYKPRFELFSPQRTVLLPADNFLGLDGRAQIVTFSAHAWAAVGPQTERGRAQRSSPTCCSLTANPTSSSTRSPSFRNTTDRRTDTTKCGLRRGATGACGLRAAGRVDVGRWRGSRGVPTLGIVFRRQRRENVWIPWASDVDRAHA